MFIHHMAMWTANLERLRDFYLTYFNAQSGPLYSNTVKRYTSYFLTFADGAHLELMSNPTVTDHREDGNPPLYGLAHIAFSTGSADQVDALTARLQDDGFILAGAPRWTGDGYYESVILDPDGNRIEITI